TTEIGALDTILTAVGTARGAMGAYINRLNHTINNLANMSDNTNTAMGRIMDTDFAAESTKMTKQNMLMQSSVAMLKQTSQMGGRPCPCWAKHCRSGLAAEGPACNKKPRFGGVFLLAGICDARRINQLSTHRYRPAGGHRNKPCKNLWQNLVHIFLTPHSHCQFFAMNPNSHSTCDVIRLRTGQGDGYLLFQPRHYQLRHGGSQQRI